MNSFLVTFYLSQRDWDYDPLWRFLEEYNHKQVTANSFVVQAKQDERQIYTELRPHIHDMDTLIVFALKSRWRGHGPSEVMDWIAQHV